MGSVWFDLFLFGLVWFDLIFFFWCQFRNVEVSSLCVIYKPSIRRALTLNSRSDVMAQQANLSDPGFSHPYVDFSVNRATDFVVDGSGVAYVNANGIRNRPFNRDGSLDMRIVDLAIRSDELGVILQVMPRLVHPDSLWCGISALGYAVNFQHIRSVLLLLSKRIGAHPMPQNTIERMPILRIQQYDEEDFQIVRILLESAADPNIFQINHLYEKISPLINSIGMASRRVNDASARIVRLLLAYGARINNKPGQESITENFVDHFLDRKRFSVPHEVHQTLLQATALDNFSEYPFDLFPHRGVDKRKCLLPKNIIQPTRLTFFHEKYRNNLYFKQSGIVLAKSVRSPIPTLFEMCTRVLLEIKFGPECIGDSSFDPVIPFFPAININFISDANGVVYRRKRYLDPYPFDGRGRKNIDSLFDAIQLGDLSIINKCMRPGSDKKRRIKPWIYADGYHSNNNRQHKFTPLCFAVQNDNLPMVQLLCHTIIKERLTNELTDGLNFSIIPGFYVLEVFFNRDAYGKKVVHRDIRILRTLLRHGANPNNFNENHAYVRWSEIVKLHPLSKAVMAGYSKAVLELLYYGAQFPLNIEGPHTLIKTLHDFLKNLNCEISRDVMEMLYKAHFIHDLHRFVDKYDMKQILRERLREISHRDFSLSMALCAESNVELYRVDSELRRSYYRVSAGSPKQFLPFELRLMRPYYRVLPPYYRVLPPCNSKKFKKMQDSLAGLSQRVGAQQYYRVLSPGYSKKSKDSFFKASRRMVAPIKWVGPDYLKNICAKLVLDMIVERDVDYLDRMIGLPSGGADGAGGSRSR